MNWGYVLAIVGSNIGIGGIVCGFIWWILSKLDSDIKSLSTKLDDDIKTQTYRIDAQNARTDKLYEMYVETRQENMNRWVDLLQKISEKKG